MSWYQNGKTSLDFTEARDSELHRFTYYLHCCHLITRYLAVVYNNYQRSRSHGYEVGLHVNMSAQVSSCVGWCVVH